MVSESHMQTTLSPKTRNARGSETLLLQVLPTCLLLHFAAADIEEAQGNITAAQQVYHGLLPSLAPTEPQALSPPQVLWLRLFRLCK